MRDGRFATPRFNAAVDGAPMLRARSKVARRKSVKLKQDFFEILAYRDTITRCDNRTRSPCCARAASGHAATAPPSAAKNFRRSMWLAIVTLRGVIHAMGDDTTLPSRGQ